MENSPLGEVHGDSVLEGLLILVPSFDFDAFQI